MAGATFFQATITKQYNTNNLMEDFKPLYLQAGVKGKGAAFIFTDKEIKEVNSYLLTYHSRTPHSSILLSHTARSH